MSTLLSLAFAIILGLLMTRVLKPFNFPAVTAYLITGVLMGPYCLGALGIPGVGFNTMEQVDGLGLISNVALGFIAFAIGNEFRLSQLKSTGKKAVIIGFAEALTATVFVDLALLGLHLILKDKLPVPVAITLGAIASATAPAATLMVVRQYKAKGKVTELLLPIVALDDAICLVVFAVSFGVAKAMVVGAFDFVSVVVNPLVEILLSLALGAVMGWVLTMLEKLFNSNSNRLALTIGIVFVTVALSMLEFHIGPVTIGFSSLLVCMMLGTVFCNICPLSEDLMSRSDKWTVPLFILFFVISGAGLELNVLSDPAVVLVGVVYIVIRSLGKYTGASVSSAALHCDKSVCKYLGVTLFPQAGVALGMCITASSLEGHGHIIKNVILFGVLIYELVGPMLTKIALTKSGDIQPKSPEVINRRAMLLQDAENKKK